MVTMVTQLVLILDGDAGPFQDVSNGDISGVVPFSVPPAWTRGAYEGGLHGESIVRGKFFIRAKFGGQGLEIGGQSFTALFEFAYGEGGGLEGVTEGRGMHGEMHIGMRWQGAFSSNLLLDGTSKGLSHLFAEIIGSCGVSTLVQRGLVTVLVDRVSVIAPGSHGL